MRIVYKKGDLFQASENIIIHGCNAQGVMGAGIAKQLKLIYPQAYQDYRNTFNLKGLTMGSVVWVDCGKKLIGNAIIQTYYGRRKGVVYCSYSAIKQCVVNVNHLVSQSYWNNLLGNAVAMPKIGAGLAEGDWEIIARIIEAESTSFFPVVYSWENDERFER